MSDVKPDETPQLKHLEAALLSKRQQHRILLGPPLHSVVMEELGVLDAEILELEREIARIKGEEYALPLPLLDFKAMMPCRFTVIGNAHRCFLVIDCGVTVAFKNVVAYKYEGINDEVLEGHRLAGRGLAPWKTFRIENSLWMAEVHGAHATHAQYREKQWESISHYLLFFKDFCFEALSTEPPELIPHDSFEQGVQVAVASLRKK